MSKKANPAKVGAFALGAVIVAIGILLVFGSGRFLQESTKIVLFFDESVEGLDVGAPVIFRGVPIGMVDDIQLIYDVKAEEFRIPVVVEIFEGSAKDIRGKTLAHAQSIQDLVDRGLRARLKAQSFLTGKLSVTLVFMPETKAKMAPNHTKLPQVPTVLTPLEMLERKLAKLPFEEIVKDIRDAAQGLAEIATGKETKDLVKNLNGAAAGAKKAMDGIAALVNAEDTKKLAGNANETLAAARKSLDEAAATLQLIHGQMGERSPLRHDLSELMKSLQDTARTVSALAEALERQPESLLKGKHQKERY
jgi:paraquat-inducible protein B